MAGFQGLFGTVTARNQRIVKFDSFILSHVPYGQVDSQKNIQIGLIEYDGPKAALTFAPRLTPEDFKCAFTTAEGWGTYRQQRAEGSQTHEIEVKYGRLQLKTMGIELAPNTQVKIVTSKQGANNLKAQASQKGPRVVVTFGEKVMLNKGAKLEVVVEVAG